MRIGTIAARAGVTAGTIRFWEDQRLLPDPARTPSGYRDYAPEVVGRLVFIANAKAAGLSLEQIREVLDIGDAGRPPCDHVTQLIAARLAEVESRIAELEMTRAHLRTLMRRAAAQDPASCDGYCPIIVPPPTAGTEIAGVAGEPTRLQALARRGRPVPA